MPLSKPFTAPNGASLAYHRVVKAEVSSAGVEITVQSWPDEADYFAGRPPLWNSRIQDGSAPTMLASLEAALLQSAGDFGGATLLPDAGTDLEMARVRRWAAIKATRQALDDAPVTHGEFEVDANASSRSDIMGAIMAMQLNGQTTRPWRCSDNVMRTLTLDDLVAIGTAIADRRQQLIEISDALWQQLQAATEVAEVEAVTWPVPEPEPEPEPAPS